MHVLFASIYWGSLVLSVFGFCTLVLVLWFAVDAFLELCDDIRAIRESLERSEK